MNKILQGLKDYFETTDPEQVKADWDKFNYLNNVGPKVKDFLHKSKTSYDSIKCKSKTF